MTAIEQTGFARLEAEGRLLNAVWKAPTKAAGRFGFRSRRCSGTAAMDELWSREAKVTCITKA